MKYNRELEDGTKVYKLSKEQMEEEFKRLEKLLWDKKREKLNSPKKRKKEHEVVFKNQQFYRSIFKN